MKSLSVKPTHFTDNGGFLEMQQKYAYIRVSSKEQNEARQVKEIERLGINKNNIIVEKASGKTFNRKKYNQLLTVLKTGDTLYINSIDRIGRDYDGILSEWNRLTKELKITVKVTNSVGSGTSSSSLIKVNLKSASKSRPNSSSWSRVAPDNVLISLTFPSLSMIFIANL